MQLTKIERVLLAEQYRILARLDPENAEIYATNCKVLEGGYELNYAALDQRFRPGLGKAQCLEVLRILHMFEVLGAAFGALFQPPEVPAEAMRFSGFHDDEEELRGYVDFILAEEGRFRGLAESCPSSPVPMLGAYRRMLREFDRVKGKPQLELVDLQRIARARTEDAGPPATIWQAVAPRGFPPPVSLRSTEPEGGNAPQG